MLYNTNLPVTDGGGTFRARFGVERVVKRKVMENGQEIEKEVHENLLAEGSYSVGSEIKDGYPEFTLGVLKKLGWDKDLTRAGDGGHPAGECGQSRHGVLVDRPLRRHPARGDQARLQPLRQRQGAHDRLESAGSRFRSIAKPIYTPRPDLVAKYPTLPDAKQFRVPNIGFTVQKTAVDKGIVKDFPLILSSGRLVEYEGGGEETRSNRWLAELKQDMYVEINPADAAERGIRDGGWVWVTGPESHSKARMKALVTERVGKGVTWMPFHFAGWFEGVDQRSKYPKGTDPYRARREREHAHDLRLRPGDRHAGTEGHPLSDQSGVRRVTMARMKFLCDADRCIDCNACVTACKNENEVPWGINRRRVVTINDGKPGERSVSMACMHCTDAPCAAVCPVSCIFPTDDGVVLHSKDLCIGCGYCFYACPFGAPQYPRIGNFGSRGKMDKCTFCAGGGGSEEPGSVAEYEKYGANRLRARQAAAVRRNVLDQIAAGRRRRDHRPDLQGASVEARLRLRRLGLDDGLSRGRSS